MMKIQENRGLTPSQEFIISSFEKRGFAVFVSKLYVSVKHDALNNREAVITGDNIKTLGRIESINASPFAMRIKLIRTKANKHEYSIHSPFNGTCFFCQKQYRKNCWVVDCGGEIGYVHEYCSKEMDELSQEAN
jgi:hypothetical protein